MRCAGLVAWRRARRQTPRVHAPATAAPRPQRPPAPLPSTHHSAPGPCCGSRTGWCGPRWTARPRAARQPPRRARGWVGRVGNVAPRAHRPPRRTPHTRMPFPSSHPTLDPGPGAGVAAPERPGVVGDRGRRRGVRCRRPGAGRAALAGRWRRGGYCHGPRSSKAREMRRSRRGLQCDVRCHTFLTPQQTLPRPLSRPHSQA